MRAVVSQQIEDLYQLYTDGQKKSWTVNNTEWDTATCDTGTGTYRWEDGTGTRIRAGIMPVLMSTPWTWTFTLPNNSLK